MTSGRALQTPGVGVAPPYSPSRWAQVC